MTENSPPTTKQYWKNQDKGIRRVNIDIPEEIWNKVAAQADLQGITKREIVALALEKYLHI